MPRITVTVTEDERAALVSRARDERRDPRAQAAIEIRQALERAGYLRPAITSQGVHA
jgi:hypothetical protein